jgi:hypothetical protein
MSEFVTLLCPRCGGKLNVAPNTHTLTCEHCGTEHIVRKGPDGIFLESFARCPVCSRNDRAEKVTAIIRTQTQDTDGFTIQTVTSARKVGDQIKTFTEQVKVPVHSSQTSELAKQLVPPLPPPFPAAPRASTSNCRQLSAWGLVGSALLVAAPASLCGVSALGTSTINEAATPLLFAGSGLCLAAALAGGGVFLLKAIVPAERARNEQKRALHEQELREYNARVQFERDRYNLAIDRWNRLYYCGRDDCVFLPGVGTHAPVLDMIDYLYQSPASFSAA